MDQQRTPRSTQKWTRLAGELGLGVIAFSPLLGMIVHYGQLPETMATHFNLHNEVNGTMSRGGAMLVCALLGLLPYLVLGLRQITKKFDPNPWNNAAFTLFHGVRMFIALIVAIVGWTIIFANTGHIMETWRAIFFLFGCLFIVMGIYMPKIEPNFTIGVRLPWTLNHPVTWRKTHRVAGPVMIIGGLCLAIQAFLSLSLAQSFILFMIIIFVIIVVPVIYSGFIAKRK